MCQSRCRVLAFCACLMLLGTTEDLSGDTPVFVDITAQAGVAQPGVLNESLAWGDYDNDGDQDLYLTNNGPNKLFRNDGGGVFTDVTDVVGVGEAGFSVGTAFGDLDRDGDLDLYVVTFGSVIPGTDLDVLYRNDGPVGPGGEYTFTDITVAAGIDDVTSSRGVALVDYDHDGLLDIYVNSLELDIVYHNLGSMSFQNVAATIGVADGGKGVGVTATDIDKDGWVDLFAGNRSGDPNPLHLNEEGTFSDITTSAGIDKVGLGMGVLSFDYDNDLDFDLYWTTWPGTGPVLNALYENLTGTLFEDVAVASGTTDPDGWGISCNAGDMDNDGWEDFFVTNGANAASTSNVLFMNAGDKTFFDGTAALGDLAYDGRGVAMADFDRDGDMDICLTGGPNDDTRLWRNDTDNGNRWIVFELVGVQSNPQGFGARIEVTTDLGTTMKEVSGGAGRGSFNSSPVEFGLGTASVISQVQVFWPSGIVQTIYGVAMDQYVTVIESDATIPTVSQWGVACMCLLILTGGTLVIDRRRLVTT